MSIFWFSFIVWLCCVSIIFSVRDVFLISLICWISRIISYIDVFLVFIYWRSRIIIRNCSVLCIFTVIFRICSIFFSFVIFIIVWRGCVVVTFRFCYVGMIAITFRVRIIFRVCWVCRICGVFSIIYNFLIRIDYRSGIISCYWIVFWVRDIISTRIIIIFRIVIWIWIIFLFGHVNWFTFTFRIIFGVCISIWVCWIVNIFKAFIIFI